jgi:WD40 repeat protein
MLILQPPRPFPVHTLAFAPDGHTLASVCGRSPEVALWDLETRTVRATLGRHSNRVVAVAFSASGTMMASASSTGEVFLWSLEGRPQTTQRYHWPKPGLHAAGQLAFSPDGRRLAYSGPNIPVSAPWYQTYRYSGQIQLVRPNDGSVQSYATGHSGEIACLSFSPDGRWLVTGSFDRSARAHDLKDGAKAVLMQGKKVHYIAFSPDGKTLATGSPSGLIKVWDAESTKKRTTLKGQASPLHAMCYSPDGRTMATAGGEGTVCFWDLQTATSRSAFDWGIGTVHAVAFAPDGMRAAAGGDGKIVIWDIDGWDF